MTTTAQQAINAIVSDITNMYHGNRTAKMRAIFEVLAGEGETDGRTLRNACAIPALWADTPTGEINQGAIYNAWARWSGRVTTARRARPAQPTTAPIVTGTDYNAFTFGIEFECGFRVGRYHSHTEALDTLISTAQRFGLNIRDTGGANHRDSRSDWRIMRDASLDDNNVVEYMVEIVSPILKGVDGWTQLEKMCAVFEKVGISVNGSCGTHVHLGVAGEAWTTLKNVGINYSLAYKAYCKTLHSSRRASRWSATYTEEQLAAIRSYNAPEEMFTGRGICSDVSRTTNHYVDSRYHAVNYVAYHQRKTLEFRQHQGTVDFRKVQSWLKDKMELITWSRTNVLTGYTDDINAMAWHSDDTRSNFTMRALRYAV